MAGSNPTPGPSPFGEGGDIELREYVSASLAFGLPLKEYGEVGSRKSKSALEMVSKALYF